MFFFSPHLSTFFNFLILRPLIEHLATRLLGIDDEVFNCSLLLVVIDESVYKRPPFSFFLIPIR